MIKQILATLVVLISCNAAAADALHRNPDQPANAANMMTFGRTSVPIGAYSYCERYAARCRYRKLKEKETLTRQAWDMIVKVNYTVNRSVEPMTDREIFGVEERWELPGNVGDCEDYVLEKKRRLTKLGIAPGAMRVTVVFDADNGGHAVLTVVTDRGDFILDNNNDKVKRWQDAELTYLKRQSPGDLTRWESLKSS
ncbi:MAG: transglutaminase-like cysteine peptidase [Ahrensia sp.]|nr:transglutaminase-like cysteine peptidase [Ahrensia sp.]